MMISVGATADIDHQGLPLRLGHGVRHSQIDEAGLLATRDDLDGIAEDGLPLQDELGGVARHAQRIGAHGAHGLGRKTLQPFGEPCQCRQPAGKRRPVQPFVLAQAGSQTHRSLEIVHGIEQVAIDTGDFEPKTVRSEIDGGQMREQAHSPRRVMGEIVTPKRWKPMQEQDMIRKMMIH